MSLVADSVTPRFAVVGLDVAEYAGGQRLACGLRAGDELSEAIGAKVVSDTSGFVQAFGFETESETRAAQTRNKPETASFSHQFVLLWYGRRPKCASSPCRQFLNRQIVIVIKKCELYEPSNNLRPEERLHRTGRITCSTATSMILATSRRSMC